VQPVQKKRDLPVNCQAPIVRAVNTRSLFWETITPGSLGEGVAFFVVSFGQEADGEMYVASSSNGLPGTSAKV
jgi:hypothetical protein